MLLKNYLQQQQQGQQQGAPLSPVVIGSRLRRYGAKLQLQQQQQQGDPLSPVVTGSRLHSDGGKPLTTTTGCPSFSCCNRVKVT